MSTWAGPSSQRTRGCTAGHPGTSRTQDLRGASRWQRALLGAVRSFPLQPGTQGLWTSPAPRAAAPGLATSCSGDKLPENNRMGEGPEGSAFSDVHASVTFTETSLHLGPWDLGALLSLPAPTPSA